jgi:hypothetical protein
MVARINTGLRNYTLNEFLESLSEASPTYVYAAIGKTTAWADEAAPDTPQETIEEEFSYYSTSAAWKRIQSADFKKQFVELTGLLVLHMLHIHPLIICCFLKIFMY